MPFFLRASASSKILKHPGRFAMDVLRGFRANQGLLLAGAVAYYALLSLIPLLILLLIALSHVIDAGAAPGDALRVPGVRRPGQSGAVVNELRSLPRASRSRRPLPARVDAALQRAGLHRARERDVGDLLPSRRCPAAALHRVGAAPVRLHRVPRHRAAGRSPSSRESSRCSPRTTSRCSACARGLGRSVRLPALRRWASLGEILVLTAIYLVMPVGRLSLRHALIGGVTAGLLWEVTRHVLVWYYGTIAQIQVVYGSLTTAIAVLLSVEIARDRAAAWRTGDRRIRAARAAVTPRVPCPACSATPGHGRAARKR